MSDARKKVKSMFGMLGTPPAAELAVGNLDVPHAVPANRKKAEPSAQLNLRVPASAKRRVKVLAARDNITASEVVLRALELYEERHGRAPEF